MRLLTLAHSLWTRMPRGTRRAAPVLFALGVVARLLAIVSTPSLPTLPELPAPDRPVTLVMLRPDEFARRVAEDRRQGFSEVLRCQRLAQHALGLVMSPEPPTQAPDLGWLDRASGPVDVQAFYAAGTDTVFSLTPDRSVLRHEMIHAIDDQQGSRVARAAAASTTDERLALRAAIEGTALVLTGSMGFDSPPWRGDLDDAAWVLAYAHAPSFMKRVAASGPEAATRMLRIAPATTHQILFEARGSITPLELSASEAAHSETTVCTDRLGALGVVTAMIRSGAGPSDALAVGRAWRGDRLEWVSSPDGERAVWTVALSGDEAVRKWRLGPEAQAHLTAAQAILLTVKAESEQPGSPFDALGR